MSNITKEQDQQITERVKMMFPESDMYLLSQRAAVAMAIHHALGDPAYAEKYGTFCVEGLQDFINGKK